MDFYAKAVQAQAQRADFISVKRRWLETTKCYNRWVHKNLNP